MTKSIYHSTFIVLIVGVTMCLLGCLRLFGYGNEIAGADVEPGLPFELVYTPRSGEPHQLWLTYDVVYQGNDFHLEGPFAVHRGQESLAAWTLALGKEGGPIEGVSSRKSVKTVEFQSDAEGSMSSTVHLVELAGTPAGEPVTVRGTWTAAPGTTVNALRLVVTD